MQDHGEEDYEDEEPDGVHSILIRCHKILPQVHGFQIEEREGVDASNVQISKVRQLVAPDLPHDHGHEVEHDEVGDDEVDEVGSRDSDQLDQ